jgi:hypothetical protein
VPPGYAYAALEAAEDPALVGREVLVSGVLNGHDGVVTFTVPAFGVMQFMRMRLGTQGAPPPATYTGPGSFAVTYNAGPVLLEGAAKAGHVLNRLAYGPGPVEMSAIESLGVAGFIEQQLSPESIDESSNTPYLTRETALFREFRPGVDSKLIRKGDAWGYFKGLREPPAGWNGLGFDDTSWSRGPSGFGYGDDDDATVLSDMEGSYVSLYVRRGFEVADLGAVDRLVLRVDFDDGFVAYLNGVEVARTNMTGSPPAFSSPASGSREAGSAVEFDLTARKELLRPGGNVLAIQVANQNLTSSDLSLIPELSSRTDLPGPALRRVRDLDALNRLLHVRGVYSRKQLQAVLAEFWNNHFTTDADKVAEYFDDLRNSDAGDAMGSAQASQEAAQVEYEEYQFFYDHALGYFGDLLLRSATSPAMLIYLDSVRNKKGQPNENYAREILELFGFGVDNRYTQQDIEQLARCFTGWDLRKIWPNLRPAFPQAARTPPTTGNLEVADEVMVDFGEGWRYFKGTQEPSPAPGGGPSLDWTRTDFNDAAWLAGATGIGYGDNDDATVLTDMRNRYLSVYLRRPFMVADPAALEGWLLSVDYDDGFVAYLNGVEVARSASMRGTGTPPPFNRTAAANREAGGRDEEYSLKSFLHLLKPAPEVNVLAIQVHNLSLDSSDLSILPRLLQRRILPGSIENGDPNGVWTFRFNPADHEVGAKTLFAGTPHQISIPAGRTGADGLRDALEVIDAMVNHPSTKEFICLKLINKFVSDEINLVNFQNGAAPTWLMKLMEDAMAAWASTSPQGHIGTVLRAILSPSTQNNGFWTRDAYRSKVKTPVEFINSSLRALRAETDGGPLPGYNSSMGMDLFTRDEPDGWSELGLKWVDTGTLLERLRFCQDLAQNQRAGLSWDPAAALPAAALTSADRLIEHFNQVLLQGALSPADRALLLDYVTTDDAGTPLPLVPGRADFTRRVRELTGLILSLPQWQIQ